MSLNSPKYEIGGSVMTDVKIRFDCSHNSFMRHSILENVFIIKLSALDQKNNY